MWQKFKRLFVQSPESKAALRVFLRIEAAVFFLGALAVYWHFSGPQPQWGMFVLFAILPEAAWFAYLYHRKPSRWPALLYNAAHSYVAPVFLLIVLMKYTPLFLLGWVANIAFLRVLGFGFHTPSRELSA
jgi:hypothetical protein